MLDDGVAASSDETPCKVHVHVSGASRRNPACTKQAPNGQVKREKYMEENGITGMTTETGVRAANSRRHPSSPARGRSRERFHSFSIVNDREGNSQREAKGLGRMIDAHTDGVMEPHAHSSGHKERTRKLDETVRAAAVVDGKLARSQHEHRKNAANGNAANESLSEIRMELEDVERQFVGGHMVESERNYSWQELNDVRSRSRRGRKQKEHLMTEMDSQTECDNIEGDKKQSVKLAKQQQQATEAKWTDKQNGFNEVVEDAECRYEATRSLAKNKTSESFLRQSELSQMLKTASAHEVSQLEELLTSVHITEHQRDELQQQCDFVDTEVALKQEEVEELLDRLEEGVYDAQQKERDIVHMDKTLEEKRRQLSEVKQELTLAHSELADVHYVFELEESTFFQLLNEKEKLCKQVNEIAAGLRQDLELVEGEIERQEQRMVRVKRATSEMGNMNAVASHQRVEHERVSRQLSDATVEFTRRKTELDSVMTEIQHRRQDIDLLSTKRAHYATELSDVVRHLNGILITHTGQSLTAIPSTDDIKGLSEACGACLTEIQKIADLKNGEVSNLHNVLTGRLSQLSAADGSLKEKQQQLAQLQSSIASQQNALQQIEAQSKWRHDDDEMQVTQRRKELEVLEANAAAMTAKLKDIERKVAQVEHTKTVAEDELNKSLTDLTVARQELEEITRRNCTCTSLEGAVSKLSADCQTLRKQNLTLQSDLDDAVKEKEHMQYQYQKLYLSAKSEIQQIKSQLEDSKLLVAKQGAGEPVASSTFVDDLEANVGSSQLSRGWKPHPHHNASTSLEGRPIENKEMKHLVELKVTSEELSKSRLALAAARQELAMLREQTTAHVAQEDEVLVMSEDCEKLRKEVAVLRNHLDKAAKEKNSAQYRYQRLLQHSKSEIHKLKSQLRDSKLFAEKPSPDHPLASSTPLHIRPYRRVMFQDDKSKDSVQRRTEIVQNKRHLGWRSVSSRAKRSIADIVDELDTQTTSQCSAMKSQLLRQLSSYEERCKSCCLEAEDFVATTRSRMHDSSKPSHGSNWS